MRTWMGGALLAALLLARPAYADQPSKVEAAHKAIREAFRAAFAAAQTGPVVVPLRDEAKLRLPKTLLFVPEAPAARLMEALGNRTGDSLLGLVMPPKDSPRDWIVVARYEASGYIKDDDAKTWNADELLKSLREGTEAQNEARHERGLPELDVVGWVEKPTYDALNRRLVWSVENREKGQAANAPDNINYNTYALGRDGYISLDLVTDTQQVATDKAVAKTLLASLDFVKGKRYQDFNASTDKVAEYGLAALIAGVAVKKLGLLALGMALLLKLKAFVLVALASVTAYFRRLFGRKPKGAEASLMVPQTTPADEAVEEAAP